MIDFTITSLLYYGHKQATNYAGTIVAIMFTMSPFPHSILNIRGAHTTQTGPLFSADL